MNIIIELRLRCLRFFIRGFFFLRPVPYHSDYRCWSAGNLTSFVGIVLLILLGILSVPFFVGRATAHDHWINNGHYLDTTTGVHCCNENDCKPMSAADIATVIRDGTSLVVNGTVFKAGQIHRSEDGQWYRCLNRCLFTPVEA